METEVARRETADAFRMGVIVVTELLAKIPIKRSS